MKPVRRARMRRASRRGSSAETSLGYRPFTSTVPARRATRLEPPPPVGGVFVLSAVSALTFAGAPLLLAGGFVSEDAYVLLSLVAMFVFTLGLVQGAKDLEPRG